jgi:hypothetical protein
MKNENANTTNAKIALFAVLGVLAAANFQGNQGKKQGEMEFASVSEATSESEELQALRSIKLVEGSEYRDEKKEKEIASTLVDIFKKIQDKNIRDGKKMNRATHNKGSCFNGNFRVLSDEELKNFSEYKKINNSDEIIQKLRRGLYKEVDNYDAQIRFANANGMGEYNPDTKGDVRAASFAVNLKGKVKDHMNMSRQDFSANSSPMFAVNTIEEFLGLMETVTLSPGWTAFKNTGYVVGGLKLIYDYSTTDALSYATEQYWGNLPYTHGIDQNGRAIDLVKFKLTPCDGSIKKESSEGKASDYLQTDIVSRAAQGKVCFNYQLQFFDLGRLKQYYQKNHDIIKLSWTKGQWVENGGANWPEEAAPFYTIAKLEIPEGSEKVECNDRYINPRLHSNRENMPIGSLARVRAEVELMSKQRRMEESK